MTEHTPTPWHMDGLYVTNKEPPTVGPSIADCGRSPRIGRAEQVANAAHIVKCVNAFPKLIAVLENVKQLSDCKLSRQMAEDVIRDVKDVSKP